MTEGPISAPCHPSGRLSANHYNRYYIATVASTPAIPTPSLS